MINEAQLKEIYPQATTANIELYLPWLNKLLPEWGIDTTARVCAFLAQVGHESGQLRYNKEIWGPTAAQKTYEGRKDLGNVIAGDGVKFKGRGLIQITGRANYQAFKAATRIDCVGNPEILEQPGNSVLTGCWFWDIKDLNKFADNGDFKTITKRINGGLNGYNDRVKLWERAKEIIKAP